MKRFGLGLSNYDGVTEKELEEYLPPEEVTRLINFKNTATQIIDQQSQDLQHLRKLDLIDDFRHMELQKLLNDFYTHQGKCERIKKFPLPRQYGSMSFVFVGIFIFLLPLGMVSEFHKLGEYSAWFSIPFTILVGWVYLMMELIGDYSENPFEGLGNDIPMLSLCRVIEIDLKQMLGETDIPPAIEAKNGVLM
jgi:putative membrane protein